MKKKVNCVNPALSIEPSRLAIVHMPVIVDIGLSAYGLEAKKLEKELLVLRTGI
jgi:hypothetical protein